MFISLGLNPKSRNKKKNAHYSSLIPINVLQVTLWLEETILFLGLDTIQCSQTNIIKSLFITSYDAEDNLPTPHSWKSLQKMYNIL